MFQTYQCTRSRMFSPKDLIAIAGQPTSKTASVLRYSFDNGLERRVAGIV